MVQPFLSQNIFFTNLFLLSSYHKKLHWNENFSYITYFQYTYAIQLALFKHLYLDHFCLFSYSMLITAWNVFKYGVFSVPYLDTFPEVEERLRASGFRMIFSMRLDDRKDIQHCTKNEVSFKDLFSKCDQIRTFLRIWSHLLKKSLKENFIFCAVKSVKSARST